MKIFVAILWFLIFFKTLFFWVWLWQLKEYHFGRFRAHFETQAVKKLISSFWRIKFPKFTKKTIVILFSGIVLEGLIIFYIFPLKNIIFYLLLLILLILSPVISSLLILLFQIPTAILRKRVLKRAQQKIEKFKNLLVIGISGSYGKTSTKEFLAEILSKKFKVLKTKKHINAEIGIAQAILNELTEDYEIFIVEIGAYERGKIKEVCQMIEPKIGILTGINEQHLSTFGSQENIIKAKFELMESLPQNGLAIFNGNDKIIKNEKLKIKNYNPKLKIVKFCSTEEKIDLWAEDIEMEKEEISFKVFSKSGDSADFKVNLIGAQNVENILLATLCAKELGMKLKEIAEICSKLKPLKGAMQLLKGKRGLNILDATYSVNPQGVLSHLDYLKIWLNKKIIVIPCLIELGSASKEIHQKIGEEMGKICNLAIITTKDRFKELKQGAQKSGMPLENILLLEKSKEIFRQIKAFSSPGDIILLESRVPKKLINLLLGNNV
ncbi:UDP-N-acetylmuramoyl-tripeptide--D-alanyl-D-alanine ligase [Patescibacteria group bacterium]|nr:UDP-N-acetylmuramoyl-tripeptide--D-alanyl-D-alanine ligase [Patescibacteria group bacterium]